MKRTLTFMTERLQIEGKLQVNLIPASSIVIHSVAVLVWMQKSQAVEAMEPLLLDSAISA